MTHNVIGFIDGENLVARYQAMIAEGKTPCDSVTHIKDVLVWHPGVTTQILCEITRLSYYQTVVGDDVKLDGVRAEISNTKFEYSPLLSVETDAEFSGSLFPKIYKKQSKKAKRVFDFVMQNGTSKSPFCTQSLTAY
ncbi:MAG: hypothetical protein RPU12_10435 [Candidatus Sedimenticola sp. (ex Thyasira tokunagai)]